MMQWDDDDEEEPSFPLLAVLLAVLLAGWLAFWLVLCSGLVLFIVLRGAGA